MTDGPRAVISLSQAGRWFAFLSLGIVLVGAVLAAFGHGLALIIAAAIAFTPLWIWVIFVLIVRSHRRSAQRLLDGHALLAWEFSPEQWRDYLAREGGRLGWLWAIMAGPFLLAGLGVAGELGPEERRWFGSTAAAFAALGGIGFALGAVVGGLITLARRQMFWSLRDEPGHVRVGVGELYVTGTYWPLTGGLYRSGGIAIEAGEPAHLVFLINARRGGTQRVRIPVPPAHLEAARRYVDAVTTTGGA